MPDNVPSLGDGLDGVQLVPPPPSLRDAINANIMQTIGSLKPGSTSAFIAVANRVNGKTNFNLAYVHRPAEHWEIGLYIGKVWGEPIGGGGFVRWEG